MKSLVDRIREGREQVVEVKANESADAPTYRFTVRRPTGIALSRIGGDISKGLRTIIVGWQIPECDVVPGGGPQNAAFDIDACIEWLEDRPNIYADVIDGVTALIAAYGEKLGEVEKKSSPPSKRSRSQTSSSLPRSRSTKRPALS
jgi:hypothetical protein